jgi:DNA processing protein
MAFAEVIPSSGSPMPPAFRLTDREALARLRLARSHNVGPRTYVHMISRFGTAERALDVLPSLAARGGSGNYTCFSSADAEAELEAAARAGAWMCTLGEPGYPALLSQIDTPSPVLWIRGNREVFNLPPVGIVGARNASANGLRTARILGRELGEAGYAVVSGLARGIDSAAHQATVATGTIAVLAGGLDCVYPSENAGLADRIAEDGALISEAPMQVEPTGRHFPKRNRLIAGLSLGIVLIEAASRSGSLITARYALDQGREVMACPGAPDDPRSAGCNALIRDGAALIRNSEDVLEALSGRAEPGCNGLREDGAEFLFDVGRFGDENEADEYDALADFDIEGHQDDGALVEQVMRLLGPTPVDLDEITRSCGASPAEIALAVLELDLAGRIDVLPDNRVLRATAAD